MGHDGSGSDICLAGAMRQGDEAFQCETCNERTAATKRLRLYRLPKVLLLHIKRFKYAGNTKEKICTNVTFPLKVLASFPMHQEDAFRLDVGNIHSHQTEVRTMLMLAMQTHIKDQYGPCSCLAWRVLTVEYCMCSGAAAAPICL